MAAVYFTTIGFEPNTASYSLSHIWGGGGEGGEKFVPVIATLPILGLKFIKLFVVRFYEQFHGFYALKAVGKSTSRNLFRYGGLHL